MGSNTGRRYLESLLRDAERKRDEAQAKVEAYRRVIADIESKEPEPDEHTGPYGVGVKQPGP